MALHILNQEKGITRYQQVIVDEAQDFGSEALKLLARLRPSREALGDDTKRAPHPSRGRRAGSAYLAWGSSRPDTSWAAEASGLLRLTPRPRPQAVYEPR